MAPCSIGYKTGVVLSGSNIILKSPGSRVPRPAGVFWGNVLEKDSLLVHLVLAETDGDLEDNISMNHGVKKSLVNQAFLFNLQHQEGIRRYLKAFDFW